uniref:Uncharacterized protein n=1 Tax=Knipowitschia caucasica TaxID=637954 RepID=A0AAV2JPM0_KNICA
MEEMMPFAVELMAAVMMLDDQDWQKLIPEKGCDNLDWQDGEQSQSRVDRELEPVSCHPLLLLLLLLSQWSSAEHGKMYTLECAYVRAQKTTRSLTIAALTKHSI